MLPLLTGLVAVALSQADGLLAPTPFDRVVQLEILADDFAMIDGRGPTAIAEYQVEFSGTLHVWTDSELDLFIQVENALNGQTIASDDDSGGGTTPYLRLDVRDNDALGVLIAGHPGDTGPLTLHLIAAPETPLTRGAARAGGERGRQGHAMVQDGDLAGARELFTEAAAELTSTAGGRDSQAVTDALFVIGNLAYSQLSSLEVSGEAWLWTFRYRERCLPRGHREFLQALGNHAISIKEGGDLPRARELEESVVAGHMLSLPADDPEVLRTRGNLAMTMMMMGELAGARAIMEDVLAARERTLPEGHSKLEFARIALGGLMAETGDYIGARALYEGVLESRERRLPADHPQILNAKGGLAVAMRFTGDIAGGIALEQAVVAAHERNLPAHHPHLLLARRNLAYALRHGGDPEGAAQLMEEVVAAYAEVLPEEHLDLVSARISLASTKLQLKDLAGARAGFEAVVPACELNLPEEHSELLRARGGLMLTLIRAGHLDEARALLPAQLGGMQARVLGALALAPRQTREVVGGESKRLELVLFLTRASGQELHASAFELQETMRAAVGEAARATRLSGDPQILAIMSEAKAVRSALSDLASSGDTSSEGSSPALARLVRERDRLEGEASLQLARRGLVTEPMNAASLAGGLQDDVAAISFRRIGSWQRSEETGELASFDHVVAHVLRPDGSIARVDLGEASALEVLVTAWRAAMGAPLEVRGVGVRVGVGVTEADSEASAGEALRSRLLDSILAELGAGTRRLHVCADDLLFLVPLDALPLEGGRVGDRWSVVNEVSLARIVAPRPSGTTRPTLLALGGVEYGAPTSATEQGRVSSGAPPLSDFTDLSNTGPEVQAAGALFAECFATDPMILTRDEATKAALSEEAPGARYLHLATHGWFAPEIGSGLSDDGSGPDPGAGESWSRMTFEHRVHGMGPMLLCGVAMAGANRGRDALGRLPGILTAEELCSLDLSQCDLAVLSACESNVGVRGAGLGIQSLQAAVYAAGARTSITSLWRVDDAATRRLFELFYTKLWKEELGKADALWQAKMALRQEGHPVRDWAGWVLTGEPD